MVLKKNLKLKFKKLKEITVLESQAVVRRPLKNARKLMTSSRKRKLHFGFTLLDFKNKL